MGERRRTVCSFCTESSKLTEPRVALVTLSYEEGESATVMRYMSKHARRYIKYIAIMPNTGAYFAILLSHRNIDQAT